MSRLYFAARSPVAGQVKTRLGASIGMQEAATLYEGFVRDLVARFEGVPYEVAWYVTPGSWPRLRSLSARADAVRIQRGRGWAERQANLFRDCDAGHEGRVVLVATDSPQLQPARVDAAFAALESHDVVFGPTLDGGYYLVGMRRFHDIFAGGAMSTASTLVEMIRSAGEQRLSVHQLEPEFDVDTEQDLDLLAGEVSRRQDLRWTALALSLIRGSGVRVA
ncbi:MAG: TIGR04282 family arsenosugar biosynthesis glycosyltransferase [Candidatus Dormibacteraceae bacterium]